MYSVMYLPTNLPTTNFDTPVFNPVFGPVNLYINRVRFTTCVKGANPFSSGVVNFVELLEGSPIFLIFLVWWEEVGWKEGP